MRIGITTDLRHQMFSAGHPNACLAVAKLFEALKFEVLLIHRQQGADWWDDVRELAQTAPKRVFIDDFLKEGAPVDLLVEIAWVASPLERPRLAKRSVWYCRKPGLFTDLEASVYLHRPEGRNLEGISAIWMADTFTHKEDIEYMKTLYPTIPIEVVPWLWTPDIVEAHRKQLQSPFWLQLYNIVPKEHEWTIHIPESNQSSTSSCTVPMTITRQAQLTKKLPVTRIMVHNSEMLRTNQFFKDNVLRHCETADLSYNLVGRQRLIDWVHEPHSLIVSHIRFESFKPSLLEVAWVGLPIVHNSTMLRDLGHGLEKLYYKNNVITEAVDVLQKFIADPTQYSYVMSAEGLTEIRKQILAKFFPLMCGDPWIQAFQRVMNADIPHLPTPSISPAPLPSSGTALVAQPTLIQQQSKAPFRVMFTDMWDDFNEAHNMFLLALEAGLEKEDIDVAGYSLNTFPSGQTPDLVIFGPFGEDWKRLPEAWPKAHFTGENSPPVKGPGVMLNIGYKLPDFSDDTYLRMPLWMFEIDWFGADLTAIRNPLPLPVDSCTKASPESYESRDKFCAFVVTNPKNPVRNQAFITLNSYKHVDSAGRLFNNVGDVIFAGLGGGGGELKKHAFLKKYRFCLTYENESSNGYTTEKILHAKAAGCVPIYWGDPKVGRDFSEKGFLNANGCKSPEDLIKLVEEVESNPARWKELASVPALNTYNRDLVRRTFAEMVRRFVTISGRKELVAKIPAFIGAKDSAESDAMRAERGAPPRQEADITPPPSNEFPHNVPTPTEAPPPVQQISERDFSPLVVTSATQRFWPSVVMWLTTYMNHRVTIPGLRARVYVGADVADTPLELAQAKYGDFAEFVRLPTEAPEGFTDFWAPEHYAWKIWIYHTLTHDESIRDRLVLYTDAGSVTLRWPFQWLSEAKAHGVCLLEDPRQTNARWCHATFCEKLAVTDSEKAGQQVVGGLMAFIAGSAQANTLFDESYKWAKVREVIAGEKWSGVAGPDGQPTGHRHDQSILSVVSQRQGCARFPLDRVYGDRSARSTFHNGQAIYVHRGNYQSHQPILPGIDDAFVINLDRREDRKKAFLEANPSLRGLVRRLPAYDGRKLQLTPSLARLFKTNDFFWKKAVMGCALSHLRLWTNFINEPPEVQTLLILEDDARLKPEWREAWMKAYPHLPEKWDCVYLGGILPPNRAGFANTLERVGPGLARVAPNQLFGQKAPNRYFHFCAYAYVLSRRGAEKILESILDRDGYWTSADHMVCNRVDEMNLYVLDPMVAGASQDDDPIYQKAEFNNFSRIDNFDSDLWNNDERFSVEEIQAQMSKGAPLQISATFTEVDSVLAGLPLPALPQTVPVPSPTAAPIVKPTLPPKKGPRFVSLEGVGLKTSGLYEGKWLQDLFGSTEFVIETVAKDDPLQDAEQVVAVLIKTKWAEQLAWLEFLRASGRTFKIIHLSDEHGNDPIHFYNWPEVKGVLRFYSRPDLPADPKVIVLPLGYHWQFRGNREMPHMSTPELPFREFIWSFAGTNWQGRKEAMEPLTQVQPNFLRWFDDWNHPKQLEEEEYLSLLLNSKFVPCPGGQNTETYRFYEALECGCIPLFVKDAGDLSFYGQFAGIMPFFDLPSWEHATGLMAHLLQNPEMMEQYRKAILVGWAKFKISLKEKVRAWLAKIDE